MLGERLLNYIDITNQKYVVEKRLKVGSCQMENGLLNMSVIKH